MRWQQNKYYLFSFVIIVTSLRSGNLCIGQTDQNTGTSELGIELQKGTKLVFAEVEEAKKRLATKDDFVKSLSRFDRSSRMKTDKHVSEKEFLQYIANQVRPWTVDEKERVRAAVESVASQLMRFELNLPQTILLIKTTGKEEGGAAYCRPNAIVLPQNILIQQTIGLEKLLIHELFHILSANNPKLKEALYEVINFKKCDSIEPPDKIREIKITNPDAPKNDHYIEVQYKNSFINIVPIIYSSAPKYDVKKGGEFFRYLRINLLAIEKVDKKWQYKRANNGEPVLLELRDVPDYFNKIGMNTGYIIHPEEILAENFVLMVQGIQQFKSKWVIERMQNLLQRDVSKTPVKPRAK